MHTIPRSSRTAVNVGCCLSTWYLLAVGAGGLFTLLHARGPGWLVKLLTAVTVYTSPIAFIAIVAGLAIVFVGPDQYPMRRGLAALMICGLLVTGAILVVGCLSWAMRGLGK